MPDIPDTEAILTTLREKLDDLEVAEETLKENYKNLAEHPQHMAAHEGMENTSVKLGKVRKRMRFVKEAIVVLERINQ